MASMELLYKALDMAIWELGEAFTNMPDADLWKRAAPELLSVGELGAHIAYGETEWLGKELIESPLFVESTRYYFYNVKEPFTVEMTAAEMYEEIKRVHQAAMDILQGRNLDSEDPCETRTEFTWSQAMMYQIFHVGYHTGQIYSVRHLLGHETVDN